MKNQRDFWVLLFRKLKLQKTEIQIKAVNQMSNKNISLTLKSSMLAVGLLILFHFPALTASFIFSTSHRQYKILIRNMKNFLMNETEK